MLTIIADALMVATRQNPFDRRHIERRSETYREENRRKVFNMIAGLRS